MKQKMEAFIEYNFAFSFIITVLYVLSVMISGTVGFQFDYDAITTIALYLSGYLFLSVMTYTLVEPSDGSLFRYIPVRKLFRRK